MLIRNGFDSLDPVLDLGDDVLEDRCPAGRRSAGDDFGLRDPAVAVAQDVEAGIDLRQQDRRAERPNRIADAPEENCADARSALASGAGCDSASVISTWVG